MNVKDKDGESALFWAAQRGKYLNYHIQTRETFGVTLLSHNSPLVFFVTKRRILFEPSSHLIIFTS